MRISDWSSDVCSSDLDPTRNTSVLWLGAGTNFQDKGQKGWALQDDLTFFGLEGHTLKMGFKYKKIDLNEFQMFPLYPQYFFDVNDGGELPYQLEYAQVVKAATLSSRRTTSNSASTYRHTGK